MERAGTEAAPLLVGQGVSSCSVVEQRDEHSKYEQRDGGHDVQADQRERGDCCQRQNEQRQRKQQNEQDES